MGRRFAPAVALALLAGVAASDEGEPLRQRVRELVDMMATGDEGSRVMAADALVALGRGAVEHVPRCAHLVAEPAARDVLAGALARIGADDAIAILVGNSFGTQAERAATLALAGAVRATRDPRAVETVDLVPAPGPDPVRIPPDLEHEIGDALPAALAWDAFPVRRAKDALQVTLAPESGRTETVEAARPRVLRVGPHKRPILVYRRLDRWYAASGSLLAGRCRGEAVELWDADLDGWFAGAADRVRIGDGAYQPLPADGLVQGPGGLATMSVRTTEQGASVAFAPEPLPREPGEAALDAVAALNRWRRGVGLPPALVNLPRSADCALHVEYWRRNGFSAHEEVRGRPGYTTAGALAGRRSSVSERGDAGEVVRVFAATVLHRASCLGSAAEGVGIAAGSGTALWGGDVDFAARGFPLLVPGPGQEAPASCEPEVPPPDRDPRFYAQPRGYPVSVVWRGAWSDVADARIELFTVAPSGAATPVPGTLFTPEEPYWRAGRSMELGSATFVADRPLARGPTYVARFTAKRGEAEAGFTWSFSVF